MPTVIAGASCGVAIVVTSCRPGELAGTTDPAADLVEAADEVFRRLAIEHRSLYRIAVQHSPTWPNAT